MTSLSVASDMTEPKEGPLYARVHQALVEAIQRGKLAPGTVLPTEKELEKQYGVSRITVRRALDDLERAGLIERGRGRPARVAAPLVASTTMAIDQDLPSILEIGRGTVAHVLSYVWKMPSADEAQRLQVDASEPVLEVARLRRRYERPVLHTVARVPAPIGALLTKEALEATNMLDQLATRGLRAARTEMEMRAQACDAKVAEHLELKKGDPVFVMERLVSDTTGRPIQSMTATFRADSFTYRIVSASESETGQPMRMEAAGLFS